MWGGGIRHHRDRVENTAAVAFYPADKSFTRSNLFVQDEIALGRDVDATLGLKADRNAYTGTEWLPSARVGWRPAGNDLVWLAWSRAVRSPSRIDREFYVPAAAPFVLAGGPEFESEISYVYELGYRAQASPRVSWSATAFYHDHEKLRSLAPTPGGLMIENDLEGHTKGVEAWAAWRVQDGWRLSGGWTVLSQSITTVPGQVSASTPAQIGADPKHWWKLRSAFDLAADWELDLMLRHYGAIAARSVPSYTAVDARLGWHAGRRTQVSLVLQNLLDEGHVEWGPGAEHQRSVFMKVRLDF